MLLFHHQTGARGVDSQHQLKEYYRTKLPQLWEAVPVENRLFPPPRDIPQQKQNHHKSRLEGLYPQQQETLQRRQFNKPQYSCINNNAASSKSNVSQYSYTCKSDLDNYVDDIQVVEPTPSEKTTNHKNQTFPEFYTAIASKLCHSLLNPQSRI